jgi:hypothetical protein
MKRTLLAVLLLSPVALADDFDRLEGPALGLIAASDRVEPRPHLLALDLAALPTPLKGLRSPVLLVKTDQGNLARVQAAAGAIAKKGNAEEFLSIVALERFATFEAGSFTKRLAKGRDLLLFSGFAFDLDRGQVVPPGQGGDLVLKGEGDALTIEPGEGAALLVITQPPDFPANPEGVPSPTRAILPTDYTGRFFLYADGSASGRLDLTIEEQIVTGRFRSEETGATFPVTGSITDDPQPRIRFSIRFPRSTDEYDGLLFSDGKGAIAGTVLQQDRPHAFFAIREGGRISPDGDDPLPAPEPQP